MKKSIAIIGGGTAGLFLAAFLDTKLYDVTIYEKKARLGRKFLVAGDGGFNLTHSEALPEFKTKYTPANFLDEALDQFSNEDMRAWLSEIGIPTFVGSSGRIFPEKGIKPIEVLRKIEQHLIDRQVQFAFNKTFVGWESESSQALVFEDEEVVKADYVVFALGGGSWEITGSDGRWLEIFKNRGIETVPFKASNCAFRINWSERFISRNQGKPLKNISIRIDDKTQKGEAVVTEFGLEGNAIYALSAELQTALSTEKSVDIFVDFKPTVAIDKLIEKMKSSEENTTTTLKEELKLSRTVIDLIKEKLTKEEYLDHAVLVKYIKSFPLTVTEAATIDEAISTLGGVVCHAVDAHFQLQKLENTFCIGEMLDWNAPTGGYLIQACASTGVKLAHHLNQL